MANASLRKKLTKIVTTFFIMSKIYASKKMISFVGKKRKKNILEE